MALDNILNTEEINILEIYKKIISESGVSIDLAVGLSPIGGTNRRCPDNLKIRQLGYQQQVTLGDGIKKTYQWYFNKFKEL